MKSSLIAYLVALVVLSLVSLNPVQAETIGAHVSKIITNFSDPGYASVAILVCAGNESMYKPQIIVSSDKDTKTVQIEGDVPVNTCRGDTVPMRVDNLSSITASLAATAGTIKVDDSTSPFEGRLMFQGISADGQTLVKVSSTDPIPGEPSTIKIEFLDPLSHPIKNVHYDISITQNGLSVLEKTGLRSQDGVNFHETSILKSDSPLDIHIKLEKAGSQIIKTSLNNSQDKFIEFRTVPEFGAYASIVLVATISLVVVLVSKTKLQILN